VSSVGEVVAQFQPNRSDKELRESCGTEAVSAQLEQDQEDQSTRETYESLKSLARR
jgi:hypothetical protein